MKSVLFSFINWWTWLLTFTSGFANVVALLLFGTAVTHHTGNISRLPLTFNHSAIHIHLFLLGLILSFFMGCVLSGVLFHDQMLRPKKRYGILLLSLGILLLLINLLNHSTLVLYTISFLSGAQNAMFLFVKTYLARTSHLTGYLTDTGFALGRILAGYRSDWRKFLFNLSQICFFISGGYLGMIICTYLPKQAVNIIAYLYMTAGAIYFIVRSRHLFGFPGNSQHH